MQHRDNLVLPANLRNLKCGVLVKKAGAAFFLSDLSSNFGGKPKPYAPVSFPSSSDIGVLFALKLLSLNTLHLS